MGCNEEQLHSLIKAKLWGYLRRSFEVRIIGCFQENVLNVLECHHQDFSGNLVIRPVLYLPQRFVKPATIQIIMNGLYKN